MANRVNLLFYYDFQKELKHGKSIDIGSGHGGETHGA